MSRRRSVYLGAREMELNRREFVASLGLTLAACGSPAEGTSTDPGGPGGAGGAAGSAGASGASSTSGASGTSGPGGAGAPGADGADPNGTPDAGATDAAGEAMEGDAVAMPNLLQRIAFGSCYRLNPTGPDRTVANQGFWDLIIAESPQVFMPLGDNIYADYGDRYSDLAGIKGFKDLMARTITMPIWDDHDYGQNDAGGEFVQKATYKQMFLDFWSGFGAPLSQARRQRAANYDAAIVGPKNKEVQFIMLDNRYDRVVGGAMLGEDQWTWLEGELKKPARLRIIESGSAVFTAPVTPESWSGHAAERQRLITLIGDTMATGVITVSGDKHYSDVSRAPGVTRYPLYDFVSSSYNQGGAAGTGVGGPANANRDTPKSGIAECSFATIAIDWSGASPALTVEYRSAWTGNVLLTKKLTLADLGET
jgi:alkaline phosphatase D